MATTLVTVNSSTYTEVLDGAGFAYSESEIEYLFSATTPTGDGMNLSAREQITGAAGQVLWARSVGFASGTVFVTV
jgi:hypothetical protein